MSNRRIVWIAWTVLALGACTETPQSVSQNAKQDTAAFQGAHDPFTVPGWKAGDKNSWEQQLKTRLQMGQNEYNKVH